jgi:serine/threonine protein kinase
MKPSPGDLIGSKYRVVRLIGDGGMGSVYEARHEVLGTAVALKFLHSELTERPGLAQRFLQEARVAAAIQSPHVARVTDVDTAADGSPYLVMELLHGESLQHLMDRTPELATPQAIDFALQILSGLEVAHAADVVHRDLKPDNVFITPSSGGPILKLIDFGIAKLRQSSEMNRGLTRAGVVMGTPEYMPPEQLYSANAVDQRADLYAVGVMLFEMLSGRRPADGDEPETIVGKVLSGEILKLEELKPDLPPGLATVVHRALAADRDARYANALEMRLALAPFATELSHAGRLAAVAAPALAPPSMIPPSMLDGHAAPPLAPATSTQPGEAGDVAFESTTEAAAPPVFAEPRVELRFPTARSDAPSALPKKPARWGRWLAAVLLLGGAATAGAFALYYYEPKKRLPPPPLFTATATAQETTVDPLVKPPVATVPTNPTTPIPANPTPNTPGATPTDAGVTGPPTATVPPFALPSTFPPVTFPPLPTGFPSSFPPLPGIFPPGTTPAPTSPSTPTATPTTAPTPTSTSKKPPPPKPGL